MTKMTTISTATLDYFTEESLAIHALCDRAGIPREFDGQALSMSQRVGVMEEGFRDLITTLTKTPPTTLQ